MVAPRLVLDTNVIVSTLLFATGHVSWVRASWQSSDIVPLASRETVSELVRVLHYPKFRLTDSEREDLLAEYLPWCEVVTIDQRPAVPRCRDPFDRPFLELALVGHADALLTGEADLLSLASAFAIPILTVTAARCWIRELSR